MAGTLDERQLAGEWMDEDEVRHDDLLASLKFIRRINRLLRYNTATLAAVRVICPHARATVLDVACGGGDLLLSLHNAGLHAAGIDRHAGTLSIAKQLARNTHLLRGDALALPFADRSIDIAVCGMTLHHFDNPTAVRVLMELKRVARHGVVVADLIRNRRALFWITVFTAFSRSIVRHDARASVRQAWTVGEIEKLADSAGLKRASVCRHFGHRFVLTWKR